MKKFDFDDRAGCLVMAVTVLLWLVGWTAVIVVAVHFLKKVW